jgi:hypothetical protein
VTYTIEVTAEDIRKGQRHAPCGCPLYLAIQRGIKRGDFLVSAESVKCFWAGAPPQFCRVALPSEAAEFRKAFDSESQNMHRQAKPLTFPLELPEVA